MTIPGARMHYILIGSIALAIAVATVTSAQEEDARKMRAVERLLAVPEGYRQAVGFRDRPGRSEEEAAMQNLLDQPGLLADLCRDWATPRKPEERIVVLRFVSELEYERRLAAPPGTRDWPSEELVAKALVEALDDEAAEVRAEATMWLDRRMRDDVIRKFGPAIVTAVKKWTNARATLLLGSTQNEAARTLLETEKAFRARSQEDWERAMAKLGNKEYEAKYIQLFKNGTGVQKYDYRYGGFAKQLVYLGTNDALKALAEDLRTPVILERVGSARLNIIDALSKAFPEERVLWRPRWPSPDPKDDSFYQKIEEWAEKKFGITWTTPRPPFYYRRGPVPKETPRDDKP